MDKTVLLSIPLPELQAIIIDCVNQCLKQNDISKVENNFDSEKWFDIDELCNYLPDKPKKATIYGYVRLKTIPYHKGGKKLRFLKSEIDAWLKLGRRKTVIEIEGEAKKHNPS